MTQSEKPSNVIPFHKHTENHEPAKDNSQQHITAQDLKITNSVTDKPNLSYEFARIWQSIMTITNMVGYCEDPVYIQEVSERLELLARSVQENSKL